MQMTFNQIPPVHQAAPIFFTSSQGFLFFTKTETPDAIEIYRSQANLHMTFKGVEFQTEIADNDTEITNLLVAFWEMTR